MASDAFVEKMNERAAEHGEHCKEYERSLPARACRASHRQPENGEIAQRHCPGKADGKQISARELARKKHSRHYQLGHKQIFVQLESRHRSLPPPAI